MPRVVPECVEHAVSVPVVATPVAVDCAVSVPGIATPVAVNVRRSKRVPKPVIRYSPG